MKEIKEIWINLEKDLLTLDPDKNIGILKRSLISRFGLFLGYDISDKKKMIILSIEDTSEIYENDFPKWEGVIIEKRRISNNSNGILIKLLNEEGIDIFNSLAKDIYYTLNEVDDQFDVINFFMNTLYKWNEFFKKYGIHVLSEEKQRGLYGELFFLYNHVIKLLTLKQSINSWCGDKPNPQDFCFINGNVEVKTTIKKEHKKVSISSEKQLDDTGMKYLFLYCITLNESINSGESLPELVHALRNEFNIDFNLKYLFNNYLLGRGYLNEHESYYEKNKYIFKKEYFFKVDGSFPRIVDPPLGVGDIKYTITISSCENYNVEIKDSLKGLVK